MAHDYDVVVVGAGIQGAAVTQSMAAHGHSVLLLEQTGVAAGTSSRSSKLIHGGLRYLESGQLKLVRESLAERAWLLRHAPNLVRRVPFYIPLYRDSRRRPWQIRLGLSLYAALAGFDRDAGFRRLPRREWDRLDHLETQGLRAVFQYWDAQTDDAALTEAVVRSAQRLGAEIAIPARFHSATLTADGCEVAYEHGGREQLCRARLLVNASGPWVNRVLERVAPHQAAIPVELVQGTHIVVPGALERGIYYVEAEDKRAVFVMPWHGRTMVGTTETVFTGDPASVSPQHREISYLIRTLGRYFPAHRGLHPGLVTESFAGLRVLPCGTGTAFSRPRDTILHGDRSPRPRLISIYGGKLTAHRATAARVYGLAAPGLPRRTPQVDVDQVTLE